MPEFELTFRDFRFPADLPEARSTFRFLFDLRYVDEDGKFATVHAVLPGLDSYWECEKEKKDEANYVRHPTEPRFDMGKIDDWDKLIILLRATSLHSLQVKVIDIEKKGGFLDKIKDYAGSIIEALIGKAVKLGTQAAPQPPAFLEDVFGSAVHDVQSFALSQLAGAKREDSLVFKKSRIGLPAASGNFSLSGNGSKGQYQVDLGLRIT